VVDVKQRIRKILTRHFIFSFLITSFSPLPRRFLQNIKAIAAAAAAAKGLASGEKAEVDLLDKEYLTALAGLLAQTEEWEAKPPAERERALNLLRIHQVAFG
jgi:hypothetical protein